MNMQFGVGPVDPKNVLKRAFDKEQFGFSGVGQENDPFGFPNSSLSIGNSIH
jgi:hypothetical protein